MNRPSILIFFFLLGSSCPRAEELNEPIDYKLSYSYFHAQSFHANDLNLRAGKNDQYLWLADYHESPSHFDQIRSGYERTDRFQFVSLISSLQVASHGFFGGAINAEIGAPAYALIGYGRTNLKPYNNLNFDPNDSFTLGAGYHLNQDSNIALYEVQDNRVVAGQRTTHFIVSQRLPDEQKVVIDVFNKSGPHDTQGQSIRGLGASMTYDIHQYFMRLAYDPKVNFTQQDMTRISLGLHF
jgi:hypothetical protein